MACRRVACRVGLAPPLPGRFSRSSLWNLLLVLLSSLRPSHAVSACSVGLLTREGIWGVPGERCVQASGSCIFVSLGQVLGWRAAGLGFLPFQLRPLLLWGRPPPAASCSGGPQPFCQASGLCSDRRPGPFWGRERLFQPASLSQPHRLPVPARPVPRVAPSVPETPPRVLTPGTCARLPSACCWVPARERVSGVLRRSERSHAPPEIRAAGSAGPRTPSPKHLVFPSTGGCS